MTTSTARSDAFISTNRERARLATLRSQYLDDCPVDTAFETLAHMARLVTGAPIALVSLVDEDKQWFKAACGLDLESTSRDISFCAHAVDDDGVLEVCDALADPRFRENPLVLGKPNIRYYLGIPIRGHNFLPVGTLCVIDDKPRLPLRDEELDGLVQLARCVESLMEQARNTRIREAQLQSIEDDIQDVETTLENQAQLFAKTVASVRQAFSNIEKALEGDVDVSGIRRSVSAGRKATKAFVTQRNSPESWEHVVARVGEEQRTFAGDHKVELDVELREIGAAEAVPSAPRIITDVLRASIAASPARGTVGLRLKADPYFVSVSVYREHEGLHIVKPGDPESIDTHRAIDVASQSMVAAGGYLEEKPWAGGKVIKLWFPR